MKYFPEFDIEEINYSFYKYWPNISKKLVKKEDIIILTGGGYAGDLWQENQKMLENVIEMFPENIIVLAPQTIYFNANYDTHSYYVMKKFTEKYKNFYIIAREHKTYDLLQNKFCMCPNKNLFFLPDFALTLILKQKEHRREGVGFCFRNDNEKVVSNLELDDLKKELKKRIEKSYSILMARTHVEIPVWTRKFFLKKKFDEFSKRELIVTDRLHGMVFAAITMTPCVALDNISGKISGVYEIISALSYVKIADSIDQIADCVEQVMSITVEQRKKELDMLQKEVYCEFDKIFQFIIK